MSRTPEDCEMENRKQESANVDELANKRARLDDSEVSGDGDKKPNVWYRVLDKGVALVELPEPMNIEEFVLYLIGEGLVEKRRVNEIIVADSEGSNPPRDEIVMKNTAATAYEVIPIPTGGTEEEMNTARTKLFKRRLFRAVKDVEQYWECIERNPDIAESYPDVSFTTLLAILDKKIAGTLRGKWKAFVENVRNGEYATSPHVVPDTYRTSPSVPAKVDVITLQVGTWDIYQNSAASPSLLVRPAYFDLYKKFLEEKWNKLVIGTPGVGKTLFLIYTFFHLLLEQEANPTFDIALDVVGEALIVCLRDGSVTTTVPKLEETYYLYDAGARNEEGMTDYPWKKIMQTSPPNKEVYRQFQKQGRTEKMCMPCWEKWEVETAIAAKVSSVNNDKEMRELYDRWGGVARSIFGLDYKLSCERLDEAIEGATFNEMYSVIEKNDVSDMDEKGILHKLLRLGATHAYKFGVMQFGSAYITDKLTAKSRLEMAA